MRLGDLDAPGAHQNRFVGWDLAFLLWSSSEADDPDAWLRVLPNVAPGPKARCAKCRVLTLFLGIGLLNAQLAQSVLRHPMQCIRTLQDSQRSRITSSHCAHFTSSTKMRWLFRWCEGTCLPSPLNMPLSVPSGSPSCPVSDISHSLPSVVPSMLLLSTGPMRLLDLHSLSNGTQTSILCGPALPAW
jgi:hypothetical protein